MMSEALANGLHRARLEPVPAGATPADRVARGKAARARVPRESHAAFQPAAGRPDPVSLLEQQAAARGARAPGPPPARAAAALGKSDVFDRAVADFAVAYADQNERDLASLAAAVASGRLEAEPGV
jgi:hypothetical protein